MSDLITIDDLKAYRTVEGDAAAAAEAAIPAAVDFFETEIGRPVLAHDITEVLDGEGISLLLPSHWPINSVSLLKVGSDTWTVYDAATLTAPLQAEQLQAYIPAHRLWLVAGGGSYIGYSQGYGLTPEIRGALFPEGVGNVLVSYNAGYVLGAITRSSVAAGGTGYLVGDTGTVVQTDSDGLATYSVVAVGAGGVVTAAVVRGGVGYTATVSGTPATTTRASGAGSGLTLDILKVSDIAKIKQALVEIAWLLVVNRKLLGQGARQAGGNNESIQLIKRNLSEYPEIDLVLNHERRRGT